MSEMTPVHPPKPAASAVNLPVDTQSNTYLHALCQSKAPLDVIREAVALGADLFALNKDKMPPLGVAIMQGEAATVSALIELGSPLYLGVDKDLFFNAALLAVVAGRKEVLEAVLNNGGGLYVNNSGMDDKGRDEKLSCLHTAVKNYKLDLLPPLALAGAFLNEEAGARGFTPLQLAVSMNYNAALLPLCNQGASLEHKNSTNGFTALHYAVFLEKPEAAERLLKLGANPNAMSNDGVTPLMMAALNADVPTSQMLLDHKANPNTVSGGEQETALMVAAKKGTVGEITLLLRSGADPTITNAFNKTASQIARSSNHTSAALVLEEKETEVQRKKFENSYSAYRP